MHSKSLRAAAACLIALAVATVSLAREPRAIPAGRPVDPLASATQLVGRMTLDEKASQLRHDSPAIPRLGIPAYNWWSEGLHGVARAGNATVFPQAIGLAATWDAPLMGRSADVIGTEFRAKYAATRAADGGSTGYRGLTVWSPNVNIFRDPRWGRGQETYGEDPYLTSRMAVAFIRGLQGNDPHYFKTIAVVKHFAVHSGPESARHRENVLPSAHDLEDTYLPAFRAAIVEAKVQGVMCAYNAIDGTPACASPLLASRIRGAWGFDGHIVSDCGAIADFFTAWAHRYSATPEQAVAAALNAGTDLICGQFGLNPPEDPQVIVRAVRSGLVSEAVLDRAVIRLADDVLHREPRRFDAVERAEQFAERAFVEQRAGALACRQLDEAVAQHRHRRWVLYRRRAHELAPSSAASMASARRSATTPGVAPKSLISICAAPS